jgi:transcriptional regulator with XRE-family HTH domain
MSDPRRTFGDLLRATRVAQGYSLRKFAEMIDVSPTYLSQIEQGKVQRPPTAERVRVMAEKLKQNPDQWIALAGRMPDDLTDIIKKEPVEMPALLRAAKGMTADELRKLTEKLRRQQEGGTS